MNMNINNKNKKNKNDNKRNKKKQFLEGMDAAEKDLALSCPLLSNILDDLCCYGVGLCPSHSIILGATV